MKFNTEEHLDEQNKLLLEQIREKYSVNFELSNKPYFENYSINNNITIYINPRIYNNSSLAHELLHAWFRSLGLHGSNMIYLSACENKKMSKIFDKKLCDHIGNCMDHCKIFPKFVSMGYDSNDFLSSKGLQCDIKDVKKLRLVSNHIYSAIHLNNYIGYLISILADHLPNNYSEHIDILKNIGPDLYNIVLSFWEDWLNVDITDSNHITRTDFETINGFILNIESWILNKSIY